MLKITDGEECYRGTAMLARKGSVRCFTTMGLQKYTKQTRQDRFCSFWGRNPFFVTPFLELFFQQLKGNSAIGPSQTKVLTISRLTDISEKRPPFFRLALSQISPGCLSLGSRVVLGSVHSSKWRAPVCISSRAGIAGARTGVFIAQRISCCTLVSFTPITHTQPVTREAFVSFTVHSVLTRVYAK